MVDLTAVLGIGGPAAVAIGIFGFLLNAYLAKRTSDREERKLEVESESGIVETTGRALEIVRSQMDRMEKDQQRLAEDNERLRKEAFERDKLLRVQDRKLAHQERLVAQHEQKIQILEVDNKTCRDEIARLREQLRERPE